jgi:hypothetical protein
MKPVNRKIIGRRELVNFPGLGLSGIEAKIDTGAYTSSIHCKEVKSFTKSEIEYVSFMLLDKEHPLFDNKLITAPVYKKKSVKNSFGQAEQRFVIKTMIDFFDEYYEIEISLADRSLMDYPLLLGRKVLRRRFIVDVSKIHYAPKRKICIKQ